MKNYLITGLVSAVLGAALGAALSDGERWERELFPAARAQEGTAPSFGAARDPARLPPPLPVAAAGDESYSPEERINIGVYETANRGVVNITTRTVVQEFFFEAPREGSGSGSVIDQHGHILTNHHVIEDARQIRVTLFNGREYEAGLVGQDPLNDIAVLKIDAPREQLHPLAFGDSSRLLVGQRVFAIGNPFGLERTMTVGIISSLNRTLPSRQTRRMKAIIQIDAALNQGNSGGPLLNSSGRLIGMNTAIASSTGENTGVGFAIPVATIARLVPQLIENGRVVRPDIGIAYMVYTEKGLAIVQMVPGGPAERAGLRGVRVVRRKSRRGPFVYEESRIDREYADVVVSVDGQPVKTVDEFLTAVESRRPGDEVVLGVLRENQLLAIRVTLDEAHE